MAQEIKKEKREDLFAPSPPLKAKKLLFAASVTEGLGYMSEDKSNGMKLEYVRRAFFHPDAIRDVHVELPPEKAKQRYCGNLKKALFGPRDAA